MLDFDQWDDGFDLYETDYASRAGHPATRANQGRSGHRLQIRNWTRIERQLRSWGVPANTIREDQAQIRRRGGRWVQTNNQPDVAGLTPGGRRTINVEVDHTGKEASVRAKLVAIRAADRTARAAGVLYHPLGHPLSGTPKKTIFWDSRQRRWGEHAGGLRRSDVLRFEDDLFDADDLYAEDMASGADYRGLQPVLSPSYVRPANS